MGIFSAALDAVSPVAGFALKHWKAAAGGLAFLLLVGALLATRHTLAGARADNQVLTKRNIVLGEKLQTTDTALHGALIQINDNNRRIAAANADLELQRQKAKADDARAAERWQGTQAEIAGLEADARRAGRKPCTISPAAAKALEGL